MFREGDLLTFEINWPSDSERNTVEFLSYANESVARVRFVEHDRVALVGVPYLKRCSAVINELWQATGRTDQPDDVTVERVTVKETVDLTPAHLSARGVRGVRVLISGETPDYAMIAVTALTREIAYDVWSEIREDMRWHLVTWLGERVE